MSYEAMLDEMRAYLKRNRISQSELARRLFVSSSAVSQWLTGRKNCSMQNYKRFYELLKMERDLYERKRVQ